MVLRDILVLLDAGPTSEERLHVAVNMAVEQDARLSAVFLHDDRLGDFPAGLTVLPASRETAACCSVIDMTRSAAGIDAVEQRFLDCTRSLRERGELYSLGRTDFTELMSLARASDLVVIGQVNPRAGPVPGWYRPEEIVMDCGRPVLMVPYAGHFPHIGQRVLVAWDGSREAVRALNDALPVIRCARVATVMIVRPHVREFQRDRAPMQRIVQHLRRHGIPARTDETLQSDNSVADVLLSRTVDLAADMIVAGAYHRSPLREALIGGVSRGLFHHMTVPVLMSH
jgi:nucleotide-binding universal stress UspA family protein